MRGGEGVGEGVWVGGMLTSSQFEREGITLKALGNLPDLYLLRILPTLVGVRRGGEEGERGGNIDMLSTM